MDCEAQTMTNTYLTCLTAYRLLHHSLYVSKERMQLQGVWLRRSCHPSEQWWRSEESIKRQRGEEVVVVEGVERK